MYKANADAPRKGAGGILGHSTGCPLGDCAAGTYRKVRYVANIQEVVKQSMRVPKIQKPRQRGKVVEAKEAMNAGDQVKLALALVQHARNRQRWAKEKTK